jgi:hypothetical protein
MQEYKGKHDVETAKAILADHYDVYLRKENPCSRTCCAHYELDNRAFMSTAGRPLPYQGRGAVDGNVCDSAMAKKMQFLLRWGTSCGTPFVADDWLAANPQWEWQRGYVMDRPTQPWSLFEAQEAQKSFPNEELEKVEEKEDKGEGDKREKNKEQKGGRKTRKKEKQKILRSKTRKKLKYIR